MSPRKGSEALIYTGASSCVINSRGSKGTEENMKRRRKERRTNENMIKGRKY